MVRSFNGKAASFTYNDELFGAVQVTSRGKYSATTVIEGADLMALVAHVIASGQLETYKEKLGLA